MKNVRKILFTILLTIVALPAAAAEVRIAGGAAAIYTVFSPIREAYEKSTGDTMKINLGNPTESILALARGEADMVSINSLSVDDAIAKANKQGTAVDPASLERVQIASSNLVIFLNRSNPVSRLSKVELKGIFTGKITNWREVGGEDREIVVLWGKETPYLNNMFSKKILDGEAITPKAQQVGDHFKLREVVMTTPGAICINTSGLAMPKLRVPETPAMPLPILAITKGKPSENVRKVLDFYKEEFGYMD